MGFKIVLLFVLAMCFAFVNSSPAVAAGFNSATSADLNVNPNYPYLVCTSCSLIFKKSFLICTIQFFRMYFRIDLELVMVMVSMLVSIVV